jgi:hypothetical protein
MPHYIPSAISPAMPALPEAGKTTGIPYGSMLSALSS